MPELKLSCTLQLIILKFKMKKKEINSSSRLINVAARLLSMELQEALWNNNINITVEQWRILYYIWNNERISQKELIDMVNKEKSTITRQINSLEKEKFIRREYCGSDKRNKRIYLTPKGQAIKEDALNTARTITAKAERNIDADNLKIFKTVLKEIITNIKNT